MKQKLELTTIGFLFLALNLYSTLHGNALVGLVFGVVAAVFFIKALRVKR